VSVALLCPGQGAQTAGFLHRLPRDAEVARTLDEATAALGHDVLALDGPDALESTVAVQLTTVVAGVAVGRALAARGAGAEAFAGLSVGAFTAAVLAGSLGLEDALRVVRVRAERMASAFPRGFGLAAVIGLGERAVADVVAATTTAAAPVYLANLLGPAQMVLAGADAGLDRALLRAAAAGAQRTERLPVAVPSHCELLRPVGTAVAEALRSVPIGRPRGAYVTNLRARATLDPAVIREDLARSVEHPVRWHDMTRLLVETGTRLFVEVPPGRVLTNLAAAASGEARAVAADDTSLETIAALAARERALERAR
jgi:malonate decarboxylase epsilon subunit